jgi:transglutaminase-like putative cysteine protease
VFALAGLGLPLALLAFGLFPRLATPLWGLPERALARPGLSDQMAPGAWLDLLTDDTPALRAQFIGATPARNTLYWRGPVLSDFDGQTWRRSRTLAALAPPAWVPGAPSWRYRLDLEPTDRRSVTALDLPLSIPDGLHRDHAEELRSAEPVSNLRRYSFTSAAPARFEADLPAPVRAINLAVPGELNPRTRALARQWRRDAGAGRRADRAIVNRALDLFHREFAYTLDTTLPGRNAVDEFLFDTRAGFCEHYSSAFTVLMRDAGIPARVVTGYVGGSYNPLGSYWLVRRSDAHAWSEVWLDGQGWVRVDPTAAVAPERIYDTLADRASVGGGFTTIGRMFEAGDWLRRGWNDLVLGFDAARQQALLAPLGLADRDGPRRQLLVLALTAAALIGLVAAWLSRRERERDPLLAAWHALGKRYARQGLGRAPHEPAQLWAERIGAARPDAPASSALQVLSRRFAAQRYAVDPGRDPGALIHDLRRHRP